MLIRSKDRKVTNAVSPNGKTATIANTFGLPAGLDYSCPSATSVCLKVCYAGKLEKIFKGVKVVLLKNWEQLKDADQATMEVLIHQMIESFVADCEKRNAEKLFRIHWDGDFFNDTYVKAWKNVIENFDSVQFWVYTRVPTAAIMLKGIPNLSLYFSADSDNIKTAVKLKLEHSISMAYLATTFAMGKADILRLVNKTIIPCPENNKKIPLISTAGSACVQCGQCVYERNDILFSSTKK